MYNKHNLLPLKMVSKLDIKPELASVAFYGNRTVGTDSFRLLEVSSLYEDDEVLKEPYLIHKNALKTVKMGKNEEKSFGAIELASGEPANPHGHYPEIDIILKEDPEQQYATIKVDGKLLGEMLQAMATMNPFNQVELRVPVDSSYKPIRLTATDNKTKQIARGLVMPQNK